MDLDSKIEWTDRVREARDVGEVLDAFAGAVLDDYKAKLAAAIRARMAPPMVPSDHEYLELERLLDEIQSNSIDVRR